jgi:uncharacterized protein with HEPN domain
MSKDQFRAPDYLEHILSAIRRINSYTQCINESAFLENEQIQDAVLRNIEIIGEAARNIERSCPEFAKKHPEIQWEDMYLMRNRISHGYFSVDLEIVWNTVQYYIPELEHQISELLNEN